MQTDKIKILAYEMGREKALEEAEKFSNYLEFDHKTALRVRLLVEETFAMVNTITEEFYADFWIEGDTKGLCKIHLNVHTDMDIEKKKNLISASREKKNAAVKGLTGKIWEMIEDHLYMKKENFDDMSSSYYTFGFVDSPVSPGAPVCMDDVIWSLDTYRHGVDEAKGKDSGAEDAWDELEKSILANLADDVKVAIRGNDAQITVEKKFPRD
ncbi:MAG: hypothetical protein J6Z22_11080 [Lachnospiraceae bacterium]|nr:hypothetical protein [Lachnospiraceae bacterium]